MSMDLWSQLKSPKAASLFLCKYLAFKVQVYFEYLSLVYTKSQLLFKKKINFYLCYCVP